MTTLKEHESILRSWDPVTGSATKIRNALLDILTHLNTTAAPNNNDALLAQDLKACAPQNASESARIRELEEEVRQLRDAVDYWQAKALSLPEQAGCRKPDVGQL